MEDVQQMEETFARISLISLPPEILINIFSHLDEKDLYVLQQVCSHFLQLINDEELWKNLFISKINTSWFPSFSQSNKYSIEFLERLQGLKQWKHNRAVKTKYVIAPSPRFQIQIEKLLFDYPRCACYNDGIITLVQLHSKRKKDRLIYIPCTTPQGCSTMNFNINAAVFGRFDGRVFGKLLSNKSYLTPVTEFNARHSTCVTAITTSASQDSSEDWCVSGSENGEVMWWCGTQMAKELKISNKIILHLALYKAWTIVLDEERIFVIHDMEEVHAIPLPRNKKDDGSQSILQIQFFKVDFGSMSLIIADTKHLHVISFNPQHNFAYSRSIRVPELIKSLVIDDATCKKEQNSRLAGGDGCFLAVITMENSIKLINIRAPGNILKIESQLTFDEQLFTCQVTSLVLVCALGGSLQIYDAAGAKLIKTVQKTDKYPQLLAISQGRMVIGTGNVLHFLQYVSDVNSDKKRGNSGQRGHSNKWEERVNAELAIYDEEESLRRERYLRNERLLELYGGDMSDEELQIEIALMESASASASAAAPTPAANEDTMDDDLRKAIEESQRTHANEELPGNFDDEEDGEFVRALERSRAEQERNASRFRSRQVFPLTDTGENVTNIPRSGSAYNYPNFTPSNGNGQSNAEDDDALQLAIALSLSEVN